MGRKLAEEPRVIEVAPQDYDALYDFSCGSEHAWETDLDATIRKLVRTGGPPSTQVHVAEDKSGDSNGTLIGVASFFPWWPVSILGGLPPATDAICLQAIGIAAAYRKALLPDDRPVGGWLLDETLEEIGSSWRNEARPVWALVHKENERCHRMLRPRSFERFEVAGTYDVWVRSREAAASVHVSTHFHG